MLRRISRRGVLKAAVGSAAVMALHPFVRGSDAAMVRRVRIGVIGVGQRGSALLGQLLRQDAAVRVAAVCDVDERGLGRAAGLIEQARAARPAAYRDHRRLLRRVDLDAVLIAAPPEYHAGMAIDAMRAGKFVGVETPAACTVEECSALVRVQRETNAGYMMLENHLYDRSVMQVQRMAENGALGELTYGAGSAAHEARSAIGPVCRWMGVNAAPAGGDRLASMVAVSNVNHVLIKTAQGRLIELRDDKLPSPSPVGQYSLQGTRGAYESSRGLRMVYLEGRTSGERWEPLDNYAGEFAARDGDADHLMLADFLAAVRGQATSPIGVIDAVTWSVIRPLSAESLAAGSKPVSIPDFA